MTRLHYLMAGILVAGTLEAGKSGAADSTQAPDQPFVVGVGAWSTCPGDPESGEKIEAVVEADLAELRSAAGDANSILKNPAAGDIRKELNQLAARGALARGLVFLYTGHGKATHPEGNYPWEPAEIPSTQGLKRDGKSYLCLPSEAISVEKILEWLEELKPRPPWATVLVNACESAFVDVSRMSFPVSVLSASPYKVSVHSTGARRSSEFAHAVSKAIGDPRLFDANHDNVLSDDELLESIRVVVASSRPLLGSPLRPWPRLRRQAPSAIPVRVHHEYQLPGPQLARAIERLRQAGSEGSQLVEAIEAQLALHRGGAILPSIEWDYIMSEKTRTSAAGETRGDDQGGLSDTLSLRPDLRALPGRPALTYDEAQELSKFATFAEVYAVRQDPPWIEVSRLRDHQLMVTTRARAISEVVPARASVRSFWREGYRLIRALRFVDRGGDSSCGPRAVCAELKDAAFALCREDEGQCFLVK